MSMLGLGARGARATGQENIPQDSRARQMGRAIRGGVRGLKFNVFGTSNYGSRLARLSRASRSRDAGILLAPHPSGELRKELPCEVAGIGWVVDILAAQIVVED